MSGLLEEQIKYLYRDINVYRSAFDIIYKKRQRLIINKPIFYGLTVYEICEGRWDQPLKLFTLNLLSICIYIGLIIIISLSLHVKWARIHRIVSHAHLKQKKKPY